MATVNNSPNMLLPVPSVGQEAGPAYATDINNCLSIIDTHNHSAGSGVQINPDGININSNLPMNGNNLINSRSLRMAIQASPLALGSDLACLYASGVDLYFNDANGNQVRITQSGGVAGSPGSISNLTSPASAAYVAGTQTFVWQSAALTPANLDAGFIILRNNSASSFGLTLSPPLAMGSNYSLVLPSLPGTTNIMRLDSSGNISASLNVDNSTIEIATNNLQVKASGITATQLASNSVTTAKIADANVTKPKLAALGQQISSSCNAFSTSSTSQVNVTNLSVTITTTGRPVFIGLIGDGVSDSYIQISATSTNDLTSSIQIVRDSTVLSYNTYSSNTGGAGGGTMRFASSSLSTIDVPSAGTYTYKITAGVVGVGGGRAVGVSYSKLIAYEL